MLSKLWSKTGTVKPGKYGPVKQGNSGAFTCHASGTGPITYSLPKAGFVSVKLYNVNGRLQSELINQNQVAGSYIINRHELGVATGSYVVVLKAGEFSHKQMIYLAR
jgi:hypothetical protein